jgi:hypothetical protein
MPGLLNGATMMMCPHGGTIQAISSNTRAQAAGAFVLRASDTFVVAGCPFILGLLPHPCVEVQWVQPATGSKAVGDFVLTEASVGLCVAPDQAVQGTALILMTQPRVSGF